MPFPKRLPLSGPVAQRLEQVTHNLRVVGPTPTGTTIYFQVFMIYQNKPGSQRAVMPCLRVSGVVTPKIGGQLEDTTPPSKPDAIFDFAQALFPKRGGDCLADARKWLPLRPRRSKQLTNPHFPVWLSSLPRRDAVATSVFRQSPPLFFPP